jgi:hypothetical protein
VPVLRSRLTERQAQVTSLEGSVASQLTAIAQADNFNNPVVDVLNPAHDAWTCGGSSFSSSVFYEYDFDEAPYCGT